MKSILVFIQIFIFSAVAIGAGAVGVAGPFKFYDSFRDCSYVPGNPGWCPIAKPADWGDEKLVASKLLTEMSQDKKYRKLLTVPPTGIFPTEYQKAYVFESGWYYKDREPRESKGGIIWTDHGSKSGLYFSKSFFDPRFNIDPSQTEGVDLRKQVIVHEIIHAIDINGLLNSDGSLPKVGRFSGNPRFVRLMSDYRKNMDLKECDDVRNSKVSFFGSGRYLDGWSRSRRYMKVIGIKDKDGKPIPNAFLPSPVACDDDLKESFAELVSYYLVDPRAPSYYPAPLKNLIQEFLDGAVHGPSTPAVTTEASN